jgi:hypothetical protein
MQRLLVVLLIAFGIPALGFSQGEYLAARLWCELEPLIQSEEVYPLPPEQARKRVLEEARGVFSAMIYGYAFSYTPGDSTRGIEDEFVLTPIADIPWGDPHLRIADAWVEDGRLFAKVEDDLQRFQEDRRRAWGSTAVSSASGTGEANMFLAPAPESKRISLEAAFKEALRNHLRPIHFNKPRQVTVELVLWQAPEVVIRAGTYQTRVDLKLRVREIRDYSLF